MTQSPPARPSLADIALNIAAFQAAWLALALSAANGEPHWGIMVAGIALALHLLRSPHWQPEATLAGLVTAAGVTVETALGMAGVLAPAAPFAWSPLPPLWLIALWAAFATTLNVGLRPLAGRPVLQAVAGGVLAPLAYGLGIEIGALVVPQPGPSKTLALAAIAATWAVTLPALMSIARRLDGWRPA
ncbi:MAG: DUF2878 domain-containing protein [Hyphomicrobiaceae bacterium]|nr:DUF2878 domain-containing protein [Hyphomicrobiaceae bacterium]